MATGHRPGEGETVGEPSRTRSAQELRDVLSVVMRVSWPWAIAMIALAIASSVDVTRPAGGGVSVHIAFGTVAVAAISLIGLPALLRLLSHRRNIA